MLDEFLFDCAIVILVGVVLILFFSSELDVGILREYSLAFLTGSSIEFIDVAHDLLLKIIKIIS